MSDPDGPNPIDIYRKVLADVRDAGIDPDQAEELADAISVDLLEDLRPRGDTQKATDGSSTELALEQLRTIAEALEEDRARLEWTAAQVAHLVDRRGKPSIDPDPTPQGAIDPLGDGAPAAGEPAAGEPAAASDAQPVASATEDGTVSAGMEPVASTTEDAEPVASTTKDGAGSAGEQPAGRAMEVDIASRSSNGSASVAPETTTTDTASSDGEVAGSIPERLPIRRSYGRRRLRAWSALLCVLVLVVAAVLLVMASRAG